MDTVCYHFYYNNNNNLGSNRSPDSFHSHPAGHCGHSWKTLISNLQCHVELCYSITFSAAERKKWVGENNPYIKGAYPHVRGDRFVQKSLLTVCRAAANTLGGGERSLVWYGQVHTVGFQQVKGTVCWRNEHRWQWLLAVAFTTLTDPRVAGWIYRSIRTCHLNGVEDPACITTEAEFRPSSAPQVFAGQRRNGAHPMERHRKETRKAATEQEIQGKRARGVLRSSLDQLQRNSFGKWCPSVPAADWRTYRLSFIRSSQS